MFEIWQEHERYIPLSTPVPESLQKQIGLKNVKIVQYVVPDYERRKAGTDWPPIAHSMIGRVRMNHLQMCMETVLTNIAFFNSSRYICFACSISIPPML